MMAKQRFFEEVAPGSEIGPLVKETSILLSVKWAGASGDYDPIHYDKEYAVSRGLPTTIVNGRLMVCFLVQMLTEWMGRGGTLRKVACQHRGMNLVGEPLTCRGKVTRKYEKSGEHYVECEIWVENPQGDRTGPGSALVTLPTRS